MHVYLQYNIHYVFVIIRHTEYVLFVSISAKFDQLADLNLEVTKESLPPLKCVLASWFFNQPKFPEDSFPFAPLSAKADSTTETEKKKNQVTAQKYHLL